MTTIINIRNKEKTVDEHQFSNDVFPALSLFGAD